MDIIPIGRAGVFAPRPLPLYQSKVAAGFPSPADDYVERTLDLNELCIDNPQLTVNLPSNFCTRGRRILNKTTA